MADPFIGEIRMVGFNFNPKDWAKCDGTLLQISEYPALFALLGIKFGGNGTSTFGVPDLRGRAPIHSDYRGLIGGVENVVLTEPQLGAHNHQIKVSTEGATKSTARDGNDMFGVPTHPIYGAAENLTSFNSNAFTATGSNQAHTNMQPSLVINFIISLEGLFPPRN